MCTTTACNHRNSRKTRSRNIHAYYAFLWEWFIDRHVFSGLCVIYNFLYFPSSPQLLCHNSIICSEQNPTNYVSARAFGAFTAVRGSRKEDNRAWVIAPALLLMPSPPHSLVWGVVDANQTQLQAYHPFQHPCHNLMKWHYTLLLCSVRHTYIFNMTPLFNFWLFIFFKKKVTSCAFCPWFVSNCSGKFVFSALTFACIHTWFHVSAVPVAVYWAPYQTQAQSHSREGIVWFEGPGSSRTQSPVLAAWQCSFLWSTTDWTLTGDHTAATINANIKLYLHLHNFNSYEPHHH